MATETTPDTEPFPWEVDPETDGGVKASMFLRPTTTIEPFDYSSTGTFTQSRVVGVHIGDLAMHIGVLDGDPEIIAALDPLIDVLSGLRDAAALRAAAAVS